MNFPARGFKVAEYESRVARVQMAMRLSKLDSLLLTTEPHVRYFTGFHTQFWQSPTRPWFIIIPAQGKPIAVVPEIGESGMLETWLDNVITWPSPSPLDDGVSLVAQVLNSLPSRFGAVGVPLGVESQLRMPYNNFVKLQKLVRKAYFLDAAPLMHSLLQIKSTAEIDKIKAVCAIAHQAFDEVSNQARIGKSERDICKQFQIDALLAGADSCPYLIAGSGLDGYDSIIMGPTDRILNEGDVLIIDTGCVRDGYFCDYDRNWAFGQATEGTHSAYRAAYDATTKGFEAARPGAKASDVFAAMWGVLLANGALGNNVGRLGHGLGMELTETPSNAKNDHTLLKPGMVLTLEPGMVYANGRSMVHEENIVITENGAEWLTVRASPELLVI